MYEGINDNKSNLLIWIAMILPIFTGLGGTIQMVISIIELIILLYYFDSDKYWLLTPIIYVYYSQLLLYGDGIALFTVYTFITIFRMIYFDRYLDKKKITSDMTILFVLFLFASFVMLVWGGLWPGFLLGTQSIALFYTLFSIRNNPVIKKWFKINFILMVLSATVYGIAFINIKGSYMEQVTLIQYGGRYSGTTSDPNYMAFYYCIAFAFLLFMPIVHGWIKRVGVLLLFLSIALTGSLTALGTVVVIIILYIFVGIECSTGQKILNVFFIIVAVASFITVMMNHSIDIPIFYVFRERLNERLGFLEAGNYFDATSGRTDYSMRYIEYLWNQNILRILFGGYQLNSMGLLGKAFEEIKFAAHNSYVDVLMTNGILGFMLLICAMISKIYHCASKWLRTRDIETIADIVTVIIVGVFMLGLSMYPSPTYMVFLFI